MVVDTSRLAQGLVEDDEVTMSDVLSFGLGVVISTCTEKRTEAGGWILRDTIALQAPQAPQATKKQISLAFAERRHVNVNVNVDANQILHFTTIVVLY